MDKELMLMAAPMAAEIARAKIGGGMDATDPTMLRNCFLNAYRAAAAAAEVIQAERARRQVPPSDQIFATSVPVSDVS